MYVPLPAGRYTLCKPTAGDEQQFAGGALATARDVGHCDICTCPLWSMIYIVLLRAQQQTNVTDDSTGDCGAH